MSEQTHQKYPPSVQHGIPRLSPAQKGWKSVAIGKLVAEVVRPVEMGDDEIYTLVTAKRSRGGIVKREDLQGREIAVKNQFYIQAGDFIISKRQIVHGACGFVPKELDGAIVSNEYLALNFTDKVIPQFWEFLTHTIYFQQVCFHSSIGVHVEKMLFKVPRWYQWTVNIPTLKEQEKIASFLGTIDIRLTQLRRKHELLQTYKRGVMQKIFSQQIRFKGDDGKSFPEWEEKKLGRITKIYDGTHQTPTYVKEGIPFYSVEHLTANNFIDTKFISEEVFLQEQNRVRLERNDILMTRIGDIGTCRLVDWDAKASFYVSLALIKANKSTLSDFLVYSMSSIQFQRELHKRTIHVAFPKKINLGEIGNCRILFPSIKEQEKIADLLTAIDQKIEAVTQQIDRTGRFKKGLLQKMFV